jgi:hypothetical protein
LGLFSQSYKAHAHEAPWLLGSLTIFAMLELEPSNGRFIKVARDITCKVERGKEGAGLHHRRIAWSQW